MEEYEISEFEQEAAKPKAAGLETAVAREASEVQMAMFIAKRFPRDEVTAYQNIMKACSRSKLASEALYRYPRGGTEVVGPSINLARVLIKNWGNADSGFRVLDSTPTESTVLAYCWDLETNYRQSKTFVVKHVRETRKGSYPLTDPRDIYELVANQAARRERSCILSVIPSDIVDAAVAKCQETIRHSDSVPLQDKIRTLVVQFQKQFGVTRAQLEKYAGVSLDSFTENTVADLKGVYNTLRDGSASAGQYFDMSLTAPSLPSSKRESPEPEQNGKKASLDDL